MPDYKYKDTSSIDVVENISEIKMGANMVLVKPLIDTSILSGGLLIDQDWEQIDSATRVVEVVKTPSILSIKGINACDERSVSSLDWGTVMELKIGDKAWVDPLHTVMNNNTNETYMFICDDQLYYLIKYDKFIVAQRAIPCIEFAEVSDQKFYDGDKQKMYLSDEAGMCYNPNLAEAKENIKRGYKIICLNGYVLIEEIKEQVGFGSFKEEGLSTEGIVKHAGRKNDFYYNRPYSDNIRLAAGDKVLCPKNRIYLESELYACFGDKTKLIVTQRRNIFYSYNPNNMSFEDKQILPGKLWVKRNTLDNKTPGGIIIPDKKPKNSGKIMKMGPSREGENLEHLKVGCKVQFSRITTEITVDEETYAVIDFLDIQWYEKQ